MTSSRDVIPFIYSIKTDAIGSLGSTSVTLVLGIDSEFELYGFEASTNQDIADINAAPQAAATAQPNVFNVFITDTSTGRNFMTQPVSRALICSNSTQNFTPEGVRIRFPRQEQFQFDFNNLTTNSLTIQFALRGYKIFNPTLA
jgi:hypothetical protein